MKYIHITLLFLLFVLTPIDSKASQDINCSIEQANAYYKAGKSETEYKSFEKGRFYYLKAYNITRPLLRHAFTKSKESTEIQDIYVQSSFMISLLNSALHEDEKVLPFLLSYSQNIREVINNPYNKFNKDQVLILWAYELFPVISYNKFNNLLIFTENKTEWNIFKIHLTEYLSKLEYHYKDNKEWVTLKNALLPSEYKMASKIAIPEKYSLHLGNGFKKIIQLNYEGAIHDFNLAILSNNNITYGYVLRGITKIFLNKKESARQDFAKAIQIDQPNSFAYTNIYNTVLSDRESFKQLIIFSSMKSNINYGEASISLINGMLKGGNSVKKTLQDIGDIYNAQ